MRLATTCRFWLAVVLCITGVAVSASTNKGLPEISELRERALEKVRVREFDKTAGAPSIFPHLPEAIFWSVMDDQKKMRTSEVIRVPGLSLYLKAIEENPDNIQAVAALNVIENLCKKHSRADVARMTGLLIAIGQRDTMVGRTARQRLLGHFKDTLSRQSFKKLGKVLEGLLENGDASIISAALVSARELDDTKASLYVYSLLFACLPPSDMRTRAAVGLADCAVRSGAVKSGLRILNRLAAPPPDSPEIVREVFFRIAVGSSKIQDWEKALTSCEKCLALGLRNPVKLEQLKVLLSRIPKERESDATRACSLLVNALGKFKVNEPRVLALAKKHRDLERNRFLGRLKALLLAPRSELTGSEYWKKNFSEKAALTIQNLLRAQDDPRSVMWIRKLIHEVSTDEFGRLRMEAACALMRICADTALANASAREFVGSYAEWLRKDSDFSGHVEMGGENVPLGWEKKLDVVSASNAPPSLRDAWMCAYLAVKLSSCLRQAQAEMELGNFAFSERAFDTAATYYNKVATIAIALGNRKIASLARLGKAEAQMHAGREANAGDDLEKWIELADWRKHALLRWEHAVSKLNPETRQRLAMKLLSYQEKHRFSTPELQAVSTALDKHFSELSQAILVTPLSEIQSHKFWSSGFGPEAADLALRVREGADDARTVVLAESLVGVAKTENSTRGRMVILYGAYLLCGETVVGRYAVKEFVKSYIAWHELGASEEKALDALVSRPPKMGFAQKSALKRLGVEDPADPAWAWSCAYLSLQHKHDVLGAWGEIGLAEYALARNASATALEYYERAANVADAIEAKRAAAQARLGMASIHHRAGEAEKALSLLGKCVSTGLLDKNGWDTAERLLVDSLDSVPREKVYRLYAVMLAARSERAALQGTKFTKLRKDFDAWRLAYLEKLTERVFIASADEKKDVHFKLGNEWTRTLFAPEMYALERRSSTPETGDTVDRLCRLWSSGLGEYTAWMRGAVGYAIWLRYGETHAGKAGLRIFNESIGSLSERGLPRSRDQLTSPDATHAIVAGAIDKALSGFSPTDSRRAWLCAHMLETTKDVPVRILLKGRMARWIAAKGHPELAGKLRRQLAESITDLSLAALFWRDLADGLAAGEEPLQAIHFYLASAESQIDSKSKRGTFEQALVLLVEQGRGQAALDLAVRLLHHEVASPRLKEFFEKSRARSNKELPILKKRIMRSPNTEVGCQALVRALRYTPVMAGAVDEVCREVVVTAPDSRAAMLVLLAKAEELLNHGKPVDCLSLLARLPQTRIPSYIRASAFERTGDCYYAQGKFRDAAAEYRKAAKAYYYEYELGGFGFFALKKRPLSDAALPESYKIDAQCMKGYLLLAQGRTYEGLARLEQTVVVLKQLPADMEVRQLRLPDAHFLLAQAYLENGNRGFGASHGHAAIRTMYSAGGPQHRAGLIAFAEMVSRRASGSVEHPLRSDQAKAPGASQKLVRQAITVMQQGKFAEARSLYKDVLRTGQGRDAKTVQDVCNGMLQCLVKEHQQDGFETALSRFRAWAVRSLPEGYEGCSSLAVAKACYLRNDLRGASEQVALCLEQGGDKYVVMHAYMLEGLIQFRSGRMNEALSSFEEVLARVSPKDSTGAEALFFVGYVSMVNGDRDRAHQTFSALVKRYPSTNYATKCRDLLARLTASKPSSNTSGSSNSEK